jgi:uncharacterized protein
MTLPTPAPDVTPETETFWQATAAGRFLLQRCASCGRSVWYPRFVCPNCHDTDLRWEEASGRGTVHSMTVTSRGILEYSGAGRYVLALVELDEGPKMLTNVVECDPADVFIGQRVEVVFHDTGTGSALPRFRPAADDLPGA